MPLFHGSHRRSAVESRLRKILVVQVDMAMQGQLRIFGAVEAVGLEGDMDSSRSMVTNR